MKEKKEKTIPDYTLDQAVGEFISQLPDSKKTQSSKELNDFLRWYGQGKSKKLEDTKATELDDYSDYISRSGLKAAENLKPVKEFFTYAKKQGWTSTNLSVHLRARKIKQAAASSSRKPVEEIVLTEEGHRKMVEELERLKEMRPGLAEEIRRTASDKDVRENAPLEAARERQGKVESRIKELEGILASAKKIQTAAEFKVAKIDLGSWITICQVGSEEILCYQLVEPAEANLMNGKISIGSPIGKAIRGRLGGDIVDVATPMGIIRYSIKEVL